MPSKFDILAFLEQEKKYDTYRSDALETFPPLVRNAHLFRFEMDYDGQSIVDHYKFGLELVKEGLFKLPYDQVIFEVRFPGARDTEVFVYHERDGIIAGAAIYDPGARGACLNGADMAIMSLCVSDPKAQSGNQYRLALPYTRASIADFDGFDGGNFSNEAVAMAAKFGRRWLGWLYGSASLFLSRDVITEFVEPSEKVNRARIKRRKPPFEPYHVVKIRGILADYSSASGRPSGRSSPRLHWRRGHIRTLSTGTKIPIAPCLVGAIENGIIDKEYLLKA